MVGKNDQRYRDWTKKAWLASLLLLASIAVLLLGKLSGCQSKTRTVIEEPDPITCDGSPLGTVLREECPDGVEGEIMRVCTERGFVEAVNTCDNDPVDPCDDDRTAFNEHVKPLITDKCLSCHFTPDRYDEYAVSKSKIDAFIRRVNLQVDNPERMPRDPKPLLPVEEQEVFQQWKDDGLLEKLDCDDPGDPDFGLIDLKYIEDRVLTDLGRLDQDDREFTRYLIVGHKWNLRSSDTDMELFKQGINKVLNSMSVTDDLFKAEPIDRNRTIYRLDLRAYGANAALWNLVEDADLLDIESFTDQGNLIKVLTQTRKPWMHFDNFIDVSQVPDVYYAFLRTADNFDQLMIDLGVNFVGQFEDFSAFFLGFNGSEISNQKNRLITRHEGEEGYVWNTYDPVDLDGVPERNLFEFPLLDGTGGNVIFDFAAGEVIYLLPNGMQGYALYDAVGNRQDVAPIDIVRDTRSPISPEISNAISCHRCHVAGIIPVPDQIRGHLEANGSQFDAADLEIALELYKPEQANSAIFLSDTAQYKRALDTIGVGSTTDPITYADDRLKLDWTLEEVAAFLLLDPDEFRIQLARSAGGRVEIGQLLTGGTITFDQFVNVLPVLKNDLRLFQEPL